MAAVISSLGNWTPLVGLTGQDARINTPSFSNIDLEDLKTIHGVTHPELVNFVQLVADAYNLRFWQAAGVVEVLLKALLNSEGPQQQRSFTP